MDLPNREMSLMRAMFVGVIGLTVSGLIVVALLTGFSMENFMTFTVDRSNSVAVDMLIPQVEHYFEHPESVASSLKVAIDGSYAHGENAVLGNYMSLSSTDFIKRVELIDSEGTIVDTYPY